MLPLHHSPESAQLGRLGLCITTLRTLAPAVQGYPDPERADRDEAGKTSAISKCPCLHLEPLQLQGSPHLPTKLVPNPPTTPSITNRVVVPIRGGRDKSSPLEHNFDADGRLYFPRSGETKSHTWAGDCSEPASELVGVSV